MTELAIIGLCVSGVFAYAAIGGFVGGLVLRGHDRDFKDENDFRHMSEEAQIKVVAAGAFWPLAILVWLTLAPIRAGQVIAFRIATKRPAPLPRAKVVKP